METTEEELKHSEKFFNWNMDHFEKNNYEPVRIMGEAGALLVSVSKMLNVKKDDFKTFLFLIEEAYLQRVQREDE